MTVVVNATPLIALAILNRLDILRQMFSEVIVPTAVYEEVVAQGSGRVGAPAAVLAGLLSKEQALEALQTLLAHGIRIALHWQTWFKEELDQV